jgi:hypothetical protein
MADASGSQHFLICGRRVFWDGCTSTRAIARDELPLVQQRVVTMLHAGIGHVSAHNVVASNSWKVTALSYPVSASCEHGCNRRGGTYRLISSSHPDCNTELRASSHMSAGESL